MRTGTPAARGQRDGLARRVERRRPGRRELGGRGLGFAEQAEQQCPGAISALPAAWAWLRVLDDVAGTGVNRLKPPFGSRPALDGLGHEPLLGRLLGDAHALADLGPRRAGPTGLVDEVADQVVGELTEASPAITASVSWSSVWSLAFLIAVDQFVEADRVGDSGWIGHASTIG